MGHSQPRFSGTSCSAIGNLTGIFSSEGTRFYLKRPRAGFVRRDHLMKVSNFGSGRTCGEIPNLDPGMSVIRLWRNHRDSQSKLSPPPTWIFPSDYIRFYLKRPRAGFVRRDLLTEKSCPPPPPWPILRNLSSSGCFPKAFSHPLNSSSNYENHCKPILCYFLLCWLLWPKHSTN